MNVSRVSLVPQNVLRQQANDMRLRGRSLIMARTAWCALAQLTLMLFGAAVPSSWAAYQKVCSTASCAAAQLTPDQVQALHALGYSVRSYATYQMALSSVVFFGFVVVGLVIFWRRSDDAMALLVSLMLLTLGADFTTWQGLHAHPQLRLGAALIGYIGWTGLLTFLLVFPDGRWVPRWTCWLALLFAMLEFTYTFVPTSIWSQATWSSWLLVTTWIGMWVALLGAQIYRYRHVSTPQQRQQTKWVIAGFAAVALVVLGVSVPAALLPAQQSHNMSYELVSATLFRLAFLLLPLSIGVAVLRYRLWDIDPLINRTLVYGALTACIVAIYVLVVGYLGALFNAQGNLAISLLATGIVAVLFQPLRERLQRLVNRVMYGGRDDPYAVLSGLGQRLEATLAPDAVLPTIVRTIKDALKLPYVAIALTHSDETQIAAALGTASDSVARVPLTYQHERVGELLLAPRSPGETFSSADQRLLDDLARQAGIAVHAVRLTHDLQQSRERIVTAREEERRRLRRDLHDGLGPTLASLTMKLDTAQLLMQHDPREGMALLHQVRNQMNGTIANVRRLVYALRPPVLDQFGLVAAIREHVLQLAPTYIQLDIDAPEQFPPLPAAVEVAAYYIAVEALTNVVRHAHAGHCTVQLHTDAALHLEIVDDGQGMSNSVHAGVGFQSMRERAVELGGVCVIERVEPHGTRVRATLPLG